MFTGKTEIFRDKFLIKEQGHFSTGITHEFLSEGDRYVLFVRFRTLINYAFYLSVNRRSIETGEYLLNEPIPSWAWLFCIICGAIVIVSRGGAIPSLIAGWPMMMVVYVSRDPTKSLNRRVAECLAYTVGAWALFGLSIQLLTR